MFFVSCVASQTEQQGEVIRIDIENDLVTKQEIIALRDSVKIVPLKCAELPVVDFIHCRGNRFYAVSTEQHKVYAFDAEGNYLFKIDKRGKAKGEYLMIDDIIPMDDVISVCDCWSAKIIDYSSVDGSFVAERAIGTPYDNAISNEEMTAVYFDSGSDKMVNVYDKSMNKLYESIDRLPELEKISYGQNSALFTHQDVIYCNPKLSNDIYVVGKDSVSLKYHLDFGKANLTKSVIKETAQSDGAFNGLIAMNKASLFDYFTYTDSYLNFIFAYSNSMYQVFYNTKTKKANVLHLIDYSNPNNYDNAYLFSAFVGLAATEDGYIVNFVNSSSFADGLMDTFRENDPFLADKLTEATKISDGEYEYFLILQKYK